MAKPTIYRSDDPNAPVLKFISATDASNIINVFKKCLVEGYNLDDPDTTKRRPAAGWSVVGEDPNKMGITLRNCTATASGRVVQLTSTNGYNCYMYPAHDASGYGTGNMINRFSTTNLSDLDALQSSSASAQNPWVLIASSKSFIFMSHYNCIVDFSDETSLTGLHENIFSCVLFGDFKPFDINDSNATLASTVGYESCYGFTYLNHSSSEVGVWSRVQVAGSSSGDVMTKAPPILGLPTYGDSMGCSAASNTNTFGDYDPMDFLYRPIVGGTLKNEAPRGYLCNIYASSFFPAALYVPHKIYHKDSREYYCFGGTVYSSGTNYQRCFFVRVDDWEE